jgi:hypothetical protein
MRNFGRSASSVCLGTRSRIERLVCLVVFFPFAQILRNQNLTPWQIASISSRVQRVQSWLHCCGSFCRSMRTRSIMGVHFDLVLHMVWFFIPVAHGSVHYPSFHGKNSWEVKWQLENEWLRTLYMELRFLGDWGCPQRIAWLTEHASGLVQRQACPGSRFPFCNNKRHYAISASTYLTLHGTLPWHASSICVFSLHMHLGMSDQLAVSTMQGTFP